MISVERLDYLEGKRWWKGSEKEAVSEQELGLPEMSLREEADAADVDTHDCAIISAAAPPP